MNLQPKIISRVSHRTQKNLHFLDMNVDGIGHENEREEQRFLGLCSRCLACGVLDLKLKIVLFAYEIFRFFFQDANMAVGKHAYEHEIPISQFQFIVFFCVIVRSTNEKGKCEDGGLLSNEKKGDWWRMKVFLLDHS